MNLCMAANCLPLSVGLELKISALFVKNYPNEWFKECVRLDLYAHSHKVQKLSLMLLSSFLLDNLLTLNDNHRRMAVMLMSPSSSKLTLTSMKRKRPRRTRTSNLRSKMRMENWTRKTMSPKIQNSRLRLTILRPKLLQMWMRMKRRRRCHTRSRTGSGPRSGDCGFEKWDFQKSCHFVFPGERLKKN